MTTSGEIEVNATKLSPTTRSVWAKSWPNPAPNGAITHWIPLHRHLLDTAGVAGHLWDMWLAPHVKKIIAGAVGDKSTARSLAVFLAGVHDIGKVSPAFAVQVPTLAQRMSAKGLRMDESLRDTDLRRTARHELVGFLTVRDWLIARFDFDRRQAAKIASVVAAHHGMPPSEPKVGAVTNQSRLLGDHAWTAVREEILDVLGPETATSDTIRAWKSASLPQHVLVLLSGFVIIADWIASNDALFPLAAVGDGDVEPHGRVDRAWKQLDLPAPWRAQAPDNDDALFAQRFNIPSPYPVQSAVMELARTCTEPPLLIVEAEMGSGKTEAALAAAEILATRFELSGIFIGLPTRATADGMFARAITWAEHLGLDVPFTVHLSHAKASLNDDFARRQRDARFRAIGDRYTTKPGRDTWRELVIAHDWFSNPKRGPLANLVVGTIDQALFGALRGRHVMLRHLALASKVVILDEIHSFDAFTDSYLETMLTWLGAYRVPVIMLSATLPSDKRKAFVTAYETGRRTGRPRRTGTRGAGRRRISTPDPLASLDGHIGYPVITAAVGGEFPRNVTPAASPSHRVINVERISDDLDELSDTLIEALGGGGCAVVIRNTVSRVQQTAAHLRTRTDIPVVVAHSRFLAIDRAAKDRRLLELFGKDGNRPERMIVVASQVVEQSLDIDFDIMATDVAPVDLVLQRSGRLHRHEHDDRPPQLRTARLLLTGVDWSSTPPAPVRGSRAVYGMHILLRTLAVLKERDRISLPDDIPALVQEAYGPEDVHPSEWDEDARIARTEFEREHEKKRERALTFQLDPTRSDQSLIGWLDAPAGDPESDSTAQAAVRDGEETLEVLVIQQRAGVWITPDWLGRDEGGLQLPDTEPPSHRLTRIVLSCSLRLPAALCHRGQIDRQIAELEERYPIQAWHGSHALRGELVLPLDSDRTGHLGDNDIGYDPDDGFTFAKRSPIIPDESEARW